MNTAHLSFYQVCRLCLLELNGSSFVPIFDNKDNNIPQKIRACFNINVEEADRLPNVLCTACARDVDRFYKFKEKVLKNNVFLKSYALQRDKKAAQFLSRGDDGMRPSGSPPPTVKSKRGGAASSASASAKGKRTSKGKTNTAAFQEASDNPLNNYDNCELSNTFFDNSNKVKVEIIPQVDNDMYSGVGSIYGDIKNNVVEMWSSSPTEESSSSSGFRTIKSIEEARAVASITDPDNSASKSPDYTSVIRHSSDDYGNGSSSFDKYISVHVKEEVCREDGVEEYDSEDTKSAASLTFHEDEDKLIIDEETMEVRQYVPSAETMITEEGVRTSDNCILLRTLISTSNPNQLVQSTQPLRSSRVGSTKKPATFSPQILVSEMHSPAHQQSSPSGGDGTPNSEKSSTRRKQRCPTKSAHEQTLVGIDVGDESEEENAEVSTISEQQHNHPIIYQQEIVNISPVTVTCSSNGREEIVGYNQTQFLDEVLSRHSSPATTPPMVVPSQAERLHKACDVLLRAASKIQDLPPGIQQEEVVVEEERITLFPNSSQLNEGQSEQITIRHNPVPLYEINFSTVSALNEANRPPKKMKSREKVQNMGSTHKECSNCHAVQTTIWRRDRFGNIVCNACGLYYKLHNYDRPCRMRRDEIHKRNRKRNANEKYLQNNTLVSIINSQSDNGASAPPSSLQRPDTRVRKPNPMQPSKTRIALDKAKKPKRSSNGNYELDSSREHDNSSGSYTPPAGSYNESAGHVSMSDLYNNSLNTSGGSIKKRRRTSAPSNAVTTITVKEEQLEEVYQEQEHELQSHIDNVEEIDVNGTEVVEETLENHVYEEEESQQDEKLNMSAFQLSTHFVPINGKVYEDDYSNENSMSETPLNLAAGSQISN